MSIEAKNLKDDLEYCDDKEPITFYLVNDDGSKIELDFEKTTSTAGGRAAIMWFKLMKKTI